MRVVDFRHFTGHYGRRLIANAGHSPPRETPGPAVDAVPELLSMR